MLRLLYLGLPLLLVVLAVLVAGPALRPTAPDLIAEGGPAPRYAITGARWVRLGRGGEPEFRVRAETLDWYPDDSARLTQLTLDALGGSGSPWRLQAPAGEAPAGERRMQLIGPVQAHGERADAAAIDFTTSRLWVDLLRRELYTEAEVELRAGTYGATARGLRADFAGERVQMLRDVKVDYVPEG